MRNPSQPVSSANYPEIEDGSEIGDSKVRSPHSLMFNCIVQLTPEPEQRVFTDSFKTFEPSSCVRFTDGSSAGRGSAVETQRK